MRDDRLDRLEIHVGGGLRARQHELRVEHVEALVLHGPHVEVVHRHDHEAVEVVFAPVGLLVPFHRPLQRVHRIGAAPLVTVAHPDLQEHVAPGGGDEMVLDRLQVARHQREQVGGLAEGILPFRPAGTGLDQVAVGQQHRRRGRIGLDAHPEGRHHVGPVGKEGDLAEALRLALGAVHAVRHVEPLQRRVGGGVELGLAGPREAAFGDQLGRDRQPLGVHRDGVLRQRGPVDRGRDQAQIPPVEPQVQRTLVGTVGIGNESDLRQDARGLRGQLERQGNGLDQIGRGAIIGQANRGGFGLNTHE